MWNTYLLIIKTKREHSSVCEHNIEAHRYLGFKQQT